jgi:hypothetical protein
MPNAERIKKEEARESRQSTRKKNPAKENDSR